MGGGQAGLALQALDLGDGGAGAADIGVGDRLLLRPGSGQGLQILLAGGLGLGGGGGAGGDGLVSALGRNDALGEQVFGPARRLVGQPGGGLGGAPDRLDRPDVLGAGALAAHGLDGLGRLQQGTGLGVLGLDLGAAHQGQLLPRLHLIAFGGQEAFDAAGHLGGDGEGLGLDHALDLIRRRTGGQEQAHDDEGDQQDHARRDDQGQGRPARLRRGRFVRLGRRIGRGRRLAHGALIRSSRCR
ncbi:hypothetical protein D3C73_1049900 [compost metagenome]